MNIETFKTSRRVRAIRTTLTYEDTISTKAFTLPSGARIIAWVVEVSEVFSGGNTKLDIGKSDDPDYYVDGADLGSLGAVALGTALKVPGEETTEQQDFYMNVGAINTQGSVYVTCLFSLEIDTRL